MQALPTISCVRDLLDRIDTQMVNMGVTHARWLKLPKEARESWEPDWRSAADLVKLRAKVAGWVDEIEAARPNV